MEVEAGANTARMLTATAYGSMNAACFVAPGWEGGEDGGARESGGSGKGRP